MSVIAIVILIFSLLGAVDYLIGNKIGVGKEFAKAFSLFAPMALSMLGMIVIAPAIGVWLTPLFDAFYKLLRLDPSIIPASLFANDMGGMSLAQIVAKSSDIGNYNAFIISSMMGCVISFTIPFSIGLVHKDRHRELFFGLLCGIATIPIGGFIAGLICKINVLMLLVNLIPLIVVAAGIIVALIYVPSACIRCFTVLGSCMRVLGIVGLACSIFTFLTKIEISPYFDTFENAAFICANACITLSGALPLMFLATKLLQKPLDKAGKLIGVNSISTLALLGTLVTNASAFGVSDKMDKKGLVLNSAFAVSASFVFGSHLAFTMAFDDSYVLPMIVAKLIAGVCAIALVLLVYKDDKADAKSGEVSIP